MGARFSHVSSPITVPVSWTVGQEGEKMSKPYQELKTYMDKAMAIKTAMTLFEWDNETLAPKEAGELTSQVIGVLSGEYFDPKNDS